MVWGLQDENKEVGGEREIEDKTISYCESKVYVNGLQPFLFITESEENKLI